MLVLKVTPFNQYRYDWCAGYAFGEGVGATGDGVDGGWEGPKFLGGEGYPGGCYGWRGADSGWELFDGG